MKTVVITQSNYIPWRGFFDMVQMADALILLDCVQYTRRDWRNRNKIKTPNGSAWLAIPVKAKGRYFQAIDETEIADGNWVDQHLSLIEQNYRRAQFYSEVGPWLTAEMRGLVGELRLSCINERLLRAVASRLCFHTSFRPCTEIIDRASLLKMDATQRLVSLCKEAGATRYLTGPAARNYMDLAQFAAAGIEVEWMNYDGYPNYPQLWGDFVPALSIVDLLFNVGGSAPKYFVREPLSSVTNEFA